jgi:hypothetical protein
MHPQITQMTQTKEGKGKLGFVSPSLLSLFFALNLCSLRNLWISLSLSCLDVAQAKALQDLVSIQSVALE